MNWLHVLIKNKRELGLRDWLIVSTVVSIVTCLIVMGIFSFFYHQVYFNVGFLGLFGYMMLFSLYVKTNHFVWLMASVVAICWFFGCLFW